MRTPLQITCAILGRVFLAVLLLSLTVSILVPIVAKHEIKKWLLANGAELVQLESLYINIWSGSVLIESLSAQAAGKPDLKISNFYTHINYSQLPFQRFSIDLFNLGSSRIPVQQQGGQVFVGPILIPTGVEESEADTDNTEEANSWGWGIEHILLNDVEVTHQMEGQPENRLHIQNAELALLQNWKPEQQAHFKLHGTLNDSPLNLDTSGSPLADDAQGTVTLNIEKLQLAPLLSPWLPNFETILDAEVVLNIEGHEAGFNIQQEGDISFSKFSDKQAGTTSETGKLVWSGNSTTRLNRNFVLEHNRVDGKISITDMAIKMPDLSISSRDFVWKGTNEIQQNPDTNHYTSNNQMTISLGGIELAMPDLSFKSQQLTWDGNSKTDLSNNFALLHQLASGKLSLTDIEFEQPNLDVQSQKISWDGSIQYNAGTDSGTANAEIDSDIRVDQLAVKLPDASIKEKQLTWKGQVTTDIEQQLNITGDLATQELLTAVQNLNLLTQNNTLQLAAMIDLKTQQPQQIDAKYSNQAFQMQDAKGHSLVTIKGTVLEKININAEQIRTVEGLKLSNIVLADTKEAFLKIAQINIDKTVNTENRTHLHTIDINKPSIDIQLDEQQQPWALNNWLARLQGTEGQPQKAEPAPAKTPASTQTTAESQAEPAHEIAIDQINVGEPALIKVVDNSAGHLNINVTVNKLSLAGLDSASPKPSPFEIDASVNRFAKVQMKGTYNLLGEVADGNWDGAIKNVELPNISPYMNGYSGYQFQNGQFSLTTSGTMDKGHVDSKNLIEIHNLQIREGDREKASAFNKKMGVPLPMAISLITDSNENVELNVPVEGSINDPNFGVQSVINIVMRKVVTEGAVGYLAATLQPYGALISIGRMVHSSTNSIELAPVVFAPGDDDLDDTADDYLKKITELLVKKESIRLNVCGLVTHSDAEAMQPGYNPKAIEPELNAKMIQLARDRADNVKEVLLDNDKITQGRLFSCVPEVDPNPDAQPRVSMGF